MWVVIGLVAWWLVGWILVPFRFVVRLVLTLIVIGLLVTLVSRLGDDDGD